MGLQRKINYIFYAPCWVAPLSMAGSCLTLRAIYYQYKEKRQLTTYQRLLLGISASDFVFSTALAFGPFPMPSERQEFGIPAYGTMQTCTAQAFFIQLGSASFAYSHMLMVYFLLVIKYNATSRFLEKKVEPLMHFIPIIFHIVTSFLGLGLEVYNSTLTVCWIAASPPGCEDLPEMECERGEDYVRMFGYWLVVFPFLFWSGFSMFWTVLIAFTVYQQNRTRFQYQFGWSAPFTADETENSRSQQRASMTYGYARSESQAQYSTNNSRGQAKMRQAITQAFLYGIWFLNFTIWTCMSNAFSWAGVQLDGLGKHYWLSFLSITLFPSQGLFNFVIYIRPTYINIRESFPEHGMWFAVKESIWNPFSTRQERARAALRFSSGRENYNSHPESNSQQAVTLGFEPNNSCDNDDERGSEAMEQAKKESNQINNTAGVMPEDKVEQKENYA